VIGVKQKQLDDMMPLYEDSLTKLRARAQVAKDHLSRHRILLDRYLPLQLGPENDVVQEVETRYGELLSRYAAFMGVMGGWVSDLLVV